MKITRWRFEVAYGNQFNGWSKAYLLNQCTERGRKENKDKPKQGERKQLSTRMERGSAQSDSNVEVSI